MRRNKRKSNRAPAPDKIVLRLADALGSYAAENDDLLSPCFVDAGHLDQLADTSAASPCIVLGRTGSGKSALLLEFEKRHRAIRLAPETLALNHISQSTIIGTLSALGVKLEPFYKLLWRHFFCINALVARFKNMSGVEAWFAGLNANVRRARKYLEEWAGKEFFENARVVSRQLTQTLENKVSTGLKLKGVELGAADAYTAQERREVVPICQDIITRDLAEQLQAVMQVTRQLFEDTEPVYFVIDGLDEDWVQEDQRYLLIMGLIQTLADFRSIPNSKIIAAIRRDLLEEVYVRARPPGFQEEKLQDIYLEVHWTDTDLTRVLDSRINETLRLRYSSSTEIAHTDVFPSIIPIDGAKPRAIDYLLGRTHMRPRDLIAFANHIVKRSKPGDVTVTRIREAEKKYSDERLRSLSDEWHVQEPGLHDLARILLRDQQSRFGLGDLAEAKIRDRATAYAMDPDAKNVLLRDFGNGSITFQAFAAQSIQRLYRYGVVRLKAQPNEKFRSGLDEDAPAEIDELQADGRAEIHPMFWQALNVRVVTA